MSNIIPSEESQEKRMINLAIELAEKQLKEGTASSQVITHYLKLGSTKEKLEKALLEKQVALASAKTEVIEAEKKSAEFYQQVLQAMKTYSGANDEAP